jgi:hypothetical protein
MSHTILMTKPESAVPAKCRAPSGSIRIGETNDSFEQEADRVAEEVMAGRRAQWSLSAVSVGAPLRRKCDCGGTGECEECKEEKKLQRRANGLAATAFAPPIVDEVLRSPGQLLDAATRAFFEPRFEQDFSEVRIHVGPKPAESASEVGALAYTVGREIVFGQRGYQPSSVEGRRLIAHELAHVVQQGAAGARPGLQRQPQGSGSGAALDSDHQKVVDAAQREASNFKCNVGAVLWGILHKHFPDDTRKVAGVGCDSGLAGLRAEFSATDPKDPRVTRSVPLIYAGKAFITSTDAARLNDRVADVGKQIEAIDDWRFDKYLIDAKDLSNPRISGQLRSLPATRLMDYRDKTKDSEVKRYAENLITFSTPTQAGAAVDPLTGNMVMTIGGVNVVIEPDVRGATGITGGDTSVKLELNPVNIPGYDYDAKVFITKFPGYSPTATLKIVTRYQAGVKPEDISGYGRGTTPEDIRNKATALRFHEGTHGEDYIEFLRTHHVPVFAGKVGDKKADFDKARKDYLDALSDWRKQINALSVEKTDCVGKTIDEFHKGEPGYKPVCP